jgi:outer membrane protein
MQAEGKRLTVLGLALVVLTAGVAQTAYAKDAGEWIVRAGAKVVDPKRANSDIVRVGDDTMFTFDVTYMATSNIGIELLAAAPFTHQLTLVDGGQNVGSTDHLPPTLSVQYHANAEGAFQPYVGAGINWTIFFNEKTTGPLEGTDLSLDDSFGLALQLGADWLIGRKWLVNADVRWIDIDTKATLDGTDLGTVEIDPFVFGLNAGYRFGGRR